MVLRRCKYTRKSDQSNRLIKIHRLLGFRFCCWPELPSATQMNDSTSLESEIDEPPSRYKAPLEAAYGHLLETPSHVSIRSFSVLMSQCRSVGRKQDDRREFQDLAPSAIGSGIFWISGRDILGLVNFWPVCTRTTFPPPLRQLFYLLRIGCQEEIWRHQGLGS